MHKHTAYQITDDLFLGFIDNNCNWIDKMVPGDIVDVVKRLEDPETKDSVYSTDLLQCPWKIHSVGLVAGAEGNHIIFLDEQINKIYSYYTAE